MFRTNKLNIRIFWYLFRKAKFSDYISFFARQLVDLGSSIGTHVQDS